MEANRRSFANMPLPLVFDYFLLKAEAKRNFIETLSILLDLLC